MLEEINYKPLNERQRMFCEEYVANGYKAMDAYLAVYGGKNESASVNAHKLLKRKDVQELIRDIQHERFLELNISADRIAQELSTIAFGEVSKESRLSYNDKSKALELLAKQFGLYTQKVEVDGKQTIQITVSDDDANND